MNDVAAECQVVVRNLVKFGAEVVAFEPIREQLKAQSIKSSTDQTPNEGDRRQYRREQPLIDQNIKQREINDANATESTETLLRKDKNKMELLLNPVLNAEIFVSTLRVTIGLERNEFIFLPSYEITNTDQKILFDLSVQLQFGKKSTIIKLLSKELIHYLRDYPLEAILESDKLIEQLILFGNSNDDELLAICSDYMKVLFKKMLETLLRLENVNYRKPQESQASRSHLLSMADQEHLRISYPSLDPVQYSKETFQARVAQSSTKIYSFITLMDAMIKNCFNLFTEDSLVSTFVDLISNYINPLLTKLESIHPQAIKRMILGYLKIFQKMTKNLNLLDDRSSLVVAPAIKASLLLLQVIEGASLTAEEYAGLRDYFHLIYDSYLAYLLSKEDIKVCFLLSKDHDRHLHQLDTEIDKMLVSVEYARDLVKVWRLGDNEESYLSDKLEKFKKTHHKLKKAVNALFICPEKSELIGRRM